MATSYSIMWSPYSRGQSLTTLCIRKPSPFRSMTNSFTQLSMTRPSNLQEDTLGWSQSIDFTLYKIGIEIYICTTISQWKSDCAIKQKVVNQIRHRKYIWFFKYGQQFNRMKKKKSMTRYKKQYIHIFLKI